MKRSDRDRRQGFTLIEVVVALSLACGAVLVAAAILEVSARLADAVDESVLQANSRRGGERLLRRIVGQMTWTTPGEPPAGGTGRQVRFSSWCDTPQGWKVRCSVQLLLAPETGGISIIVDGSHAYTLLEREGVASVLYLESAAHGGRWGTEWTDATELPVALGFVTTADTLIVRTGGLG